MGTPDDGRIDGARDNAGAGPIARTSDGAITGSRKPRIEVLRAGSAASTTHQTLPEATAAEPRTLRPPQPEPLSPPYPNEPATRSFSSEHTEPVHQARRIRLPVVLLGAALLALLILGVLFMVSFPQSDDEPASERNSTVGTPQTELLENSPAPNQERALEPAADVAQLESSSVDLPAREDPVEAPSLRPVPSARRTVVPAEEPNISSLPADEPAAGNAPAEATNALRTVRAFYGALAVGNGDAAAQLVVPGKRQSGPLSAAALTRYYSSFQRPLQIAQVTASDADTVRVVYDYVLPGGRLCEGRATLKLVQSGDGPLIQSIRAEGPC